MFSTSVLPAAVDVGASLEETTGIVRYLLVFVLAMVPAVEPFVVIPVAIGLGLDPAATGVAAFAGSATAAYAIVCFHRRLATWWSRRRGRNGEDAPEATGRYGRARRIWERYGVAGLALVGPILAGIHLTALLATVVDDRPRAVVGWLTVGLGAWTVVLVVGSVIGFSLLGVS